MTAAPKGETKADAENTDPVANATADTTTAPVAEEPTPVVPGPNDPVPAGQVEVTSKAPEDKLSDASGNKIEQKKVTRAPRKTDPFKKEIDHEKLPVAVAIGQVTGSIESYSGRAVLSLSLRGWVGEAPFKILAEDAGEVEAVLDELRAQL